jgi:subtilisin family serine protease
MYGSPSIDPPPAQQHTDGCMPSGLYALATLWMIALTVVTHIVVWFTGELLLAEGKSLTAPMWIGIILVLTLAQTFPIGLLRVFGPPPRYRVIYQAWLWAIGIGFVLSMVKLVPSTWTQTASLVQIVLGTLAALVLLFGPGSRGPRGSGTVTGIAQPIALGLLVGLPWFFHGALGSLLDTVLNLLASIVLGWMTALLIDKRLIAPLAQLGRDAGADVSLGGLAAGIVLLVLSVSFGFDGQQIPLMLMLPPLGFAAAALSRRAPGRSTRPVAGLLATALAGPLLFFDPDEFTILLGLEGGELFGTVLTAAFQSFLLAWAISAVLRVRSRRDYSQPNRILELGSLIGAAVLALLIYFGGGQPGLYGERLFVILRDQADVSQAANITDRAERLAFVYNTLTQHANTTQANLRATLDRFGVEYQPYYLVNAIEVQGGPLLRAYLSMQPEVDRIIDSPRLRPLPNELQLGVGDLAAPNEPPWNISAIGADRVWREFNVRGAGIVVGESDSGVEGDHPALRDNYRGRDGEHDYNWYDPWFASTSPVDIGGHGTHTTGTIVGRGDIGVAPEAEWIGCVNLGRNLANPALYLDCLQFMLAPFPQGGDPLRDGDTNRAAHVLNNSWGCPELEGCDAESLLPAVRALRAAGIFVVVSAGNEGPSCSTVSSPLAIYDEVFSVGAFDANGNVASFSSRGPVTVDGSQRIKPDIIAPGVDVLSALPGGTYGLNDGTSMAGPHVAGVVALMWSANPALIGDIERTEQILIDTALPYRGDRTLGCFSGDLPSNAYGYGMLDAYAAVAAALDAR